MQWSLTPQPPYLIPPVLQVDSKWRHLSLPSFQDKLLAHRPGMHSTSFTGSTPNEVNSLTSIPTTKNTCYQDNSSLAAQHKLGIATINDRPLPVSPLPHS